MPSALLSFVFPAATGSSIYQWFRNWDAGNLHCERFTPLSFGFITITFCLGRTQCRIMLCFVLQAT